MNYTDEDSTTQLKRQERAEALRRSRQEVAQKVAGINDLAGLVAQCGLQLAEAMPHNWSRGELSIEVMRRRVTDLVALNATYLLSGERVDRETLPENRFTDRFVQKPSKYKLYREKGGKYYVGLIYSDKWLELAAGKTALVCARDKRAETLVALGRLADQGCFDQQICAIRDARRQQAAKSAARKRNKGKNPQIC